MLINIKQDRPAKIANTQDENLLLLLKTDYDYFTNDSPQDVTEELSEEDRNELISLVKEPFEHDTISQNELDEAILQWHTR